MDFDSHRWRHIRDEAFGRFLAAGIRTQTTRGRSLEAEVHALQLRTLEGRQLRVLSAGNGATEADIGKFWFVPGYSLVGGPDIVPES